MLLTKIHSEEHNGPCVLVQEECEHALDISVLDRVHAAGLAGEVIGFAILNCAEIASESRPALYVVQFPGGEPDLYTAAAIRQSFLERVPQGTATAGSQSLFKPGDKVIVYGDTPGVVDSLDDRPGWYMVRLGDPPVQCSITRVTESDLSPR